MKKRTSDLCKNAWVGLGTFVLGMGIAALGKFALDKFGSKSQIAGEGGKFFTGEDPIVEAAKHL